MNDDIEKILKRKIKEVERWVRDDLPRQAGKTAVDHFRENFVREGFMDGGRQEVEGGETPHAVERMVRIRIQGGKAQLLHLCPEQKDGQDPQGEEPEEAQLLQSRHRPQDPERAHARAAGQHPVQRGAAGRGNPLGQALCGGATTGATSACSAGGRQNCPHAPLSGIRRSWMRK